MTIPAFSPLAPSMQTSIDEVCIEGIFESELIYITHAGRGRGRAAREYTSLDKTD